MLKRAGQKEQCDEGFHCWSFFGMGMINIPKSKTKFSRTNVFFDAAIFVVQFF